MVGTHLANLPRWASELLSSARVAHLGLLDDEDHPRVLPVTFALAEGRIWTAIDFKRKRAPGRAPARIRFLERNSRAALTADRYSDEWEQLAWVQVLGNAEILEPSDAPAGLACLIAKYEQYREATPAGPLIGLAPARCLFWRAQHNGGGG